MNSKLLFCMTLCLLFSCAPVMAQTESEKQERDDFWERFESRFDRFMSDVLNDFESPAKREAHDSLQRMAISTITSDTTIAAGDTLHGSIVVDHATLNVRGVVDGNVEARSGTVALYDGSLITGELRMSESRLTREDKARVYGTIDQSDVPWADHDRNWWEPLPRRGISLPWTNESWVADPFHMRYNRVEGLYFGLGSPKKYSWDRDRKFSGYGTLGYGFALHRWRGSLGVTRQFAFPSTTEDWLWEVGAEGYSLTDNRDPWIIGQSENTAAAFFLRQDYRDYFQREGFTAHVAVYARIGEAYGEGNLSFLADRYSSLPNHASWSMFGGDRVFRENPAIDDGQMRSVTALLGYSTSPPEERIPDGWNNFISAEFANSSALGGAFTFSRYQLELRRYQPIGKYDRVNVRFRIGTAHGDLPRQKSYELGGPGTLPAYGFATLPGDSMGANRMFLINGEYSVNGDFLHDISFWPSWLFEHVNFLFLADAGFARTVPGSTGAFAGFGGIHWNDLQSDIGVGISNVSGSLRAAVLWRTDRSEPARFTVRVSRPF